MTGVLVAALVSGTDDRSSGADGATIVPENVATSAASQDVGVANEVALPTSLANEVASLTSLANASVSIAVADASNLVFGEVFAQWLADLGYTVTRSTSESRDLRVTTVYYEPSSIDSFAVAESVASLMGGVRVLPFPAFAVIDDGAERGESVVVVLGSDMADLMLELATTPTSVRPGTTVTPTSVRPATTTTSAGTTTVAP